MQISQKNNAHLFNSVRQFPLFLIILSVLFVASTLPVQSQPQPDDLIICVNNIVTNGELTIRGLTANFPYPVLSMISVVDSQANIVPGLADTLRWLNSMDTAENGMPISEIWNPLMEYHSADPSIPDDPNVYNQSQGPLITEIRETEPIPTCTKLVMDVSSSMEQEIEDAKEGARIYIRLFRPFDSGGIVQFAGNVVDVQEMTRDTTVLIDNINNIQLYNGTAIYDALMVAIDGLKASRGRRSIIIYTDGADNRSSVTPQAVIDSAQTYNLPIYTIALGNRAEEGVLRDIAEQTSAMFFRAATAEEMQQILGKLSILMKNYYVMAHGSTDPNYNRTWRTVDVTTNTGEATGRGIGHYFVGGGPEIPATDLAVELSSITDTTIVVAGDTMNAVPPGDEFRYTIRVQNFGPNTAGSVKLVQHLPDSVRFVSATPAPQLGSPDSLVWDLMNFMPMMDWNLSVRVRLADDVPLNLTELVSSATIYARGDTLRENNTAVDTVRVLFPPPIENYDLALEQTAITDTTVEISGQTEPAVILGDSYRYSLKIENRGPATARNITIRDVLPDSVIPADFNLIPNRQTPDSLFWLLDSLQAGGAVEIEFSCLVREKVPITPFPLVNQTRLIAEFDTTADNNQQTTTVYAIDKTEPVSPPIDLTFEFYSITDTFVVEDRDTSNAVFPGENYQYFIRIQNPDNYPADSVAISQVLPDSVRLVQADPSPQIQPDKSLRWTLDKLDPGDGTQILVGVRLAEPIPKTETELLSRVDVAAKNDTNQTNNSKMDTVKVLFRDGPLPGKNFNLVVKQSVEADTTILLANQEEDAVFAGNTYRYVLLVQNAGPGTAQDFLIWDILPDSVSLVSANISPANQIADSLFWKIDTLMPDDSTKIVLDVTLTDSLPFTPFPLLNQSGIIAKNDTLSEDNITLSRVYGIQISDIPHPNEIDISVSQFAKTDSFEVFDGDTLKYVTPGKTYAYHLQVKNETDVVAPDVRVSDILPNFVTVGNFQPAPTTQTRDSLVWEIGNLNPQKSYEIRFDATVPTQMPPGDSYLINKVTGWAENEKPEYLANNVSIDTVINVNMPPIGWEPFIEAIPERVSVGENIKIKVRATAEIYDWDLWIRRANGEIDSTYADNFILMNPLQPDVWLDVQPEYPVTNMTTDAEDEPIIFELRGSDAWGTTKTAQVSVTIQQTSDFNIDRNVFRPDQEGDLEIRFKLKSNEVAKLEIYDITGTRITKLGETQFQSGWNTYHWNGLTEHGQKIGSGFYIITIQSSGYHAWKKLLIVR